MTPTHDELSRLLLECVRDEAIFALDAQGRVCSWNPGARAVLGFADDDVTGRHVSVFYPPEDVQLGRPERELRLAQAGRFEVEGWRLRADGTRVLAHVIMAPLEHPDGRRLPGYAVVLRDITERIRAEEALRASEGKFSGIISISSDAIVSVDETQRIVHFNRGAEAVFGWKQHEIVGQPLNVLLPGYARDRHGEHVRRFAEGPVVAKRMGERQEIFGVRKNGEEFPAEASISKLELGAQRLFTAVLRDVTDRKEAERALAQALEQAREATGAAQAAVRAREDVLHVVSHDLGNSLSAIVVNTTVLLKTLPPDAEDVRQRVSSVRDLARRMQRLRQDLLDVASIEQGQLSVEWDSWHPGAVVSEAVEAFAPLAGEKGLELVAEVEPDVPEVEGDRDRVLQVLANLLGNAVKFTPAGGRVTLRVRAAPDEVRFAVGDTGPGIAPENQGLVWDRFWKSRTANRHGAGLGLAISRGIVEAHGGRIWLESAEGAGSTFFFTLPLHPAPPEDEDLPPE
ncbi:PAS domain S-box protein [Longimicrobium sp.]|uniref:sensor histidine kinase n=1 Tax=Longimicrobium sp. TaxID=2029185 RepID=UPI002E348840|nr:PAS domain S-box protein [Longimicrobium sp.]HEX6041148.1 PAS domain S-box protein [Longimicrobium sp.]